MTRNIHIVFTGGGTLGHLTPALAVATNLAERVKNLRVTFAGSGKSMERDFVTRAGFDYLAVASRPLPRRASEAFSFLFDNMAGYFSAGRFLDEADVDAVVASGGYVSLPMGRAAARRRLPLVLLEQNVVPGQANRWLSRWARLMCTSFAETEVSAKLKCPVRFTGNPTFPAAPQASTNFLERRQLIVLGGSGGARSLNENVPKALHKIRDQLAGWKIMHQTGAADLDATRELYRKLALDAEVAALWTDVREMLPHAGLAVCRAGGTTLAELAVAGVPAVLLPYPNAAENHQRKNAAVFASAGAASMVDEIDPEGRLDDRLAEALAMTIGFDAAREGMSQAMQRMAQPDAAAQAAKLIWSVFSSQAKRVRPAVV
jgi:UDP-N-acetylglucosamine--N-acetylmuramyl-(pentapeptide) pyrophosphoryl-undecaprenol N-acetylglucosamine transferase